MLCPTPVGGYEILTHRLRDANGLLFRIVALWCERTHLFEAELMTNMNLLNFTSRLLIAIVSF